jgi:hypothetical protein
MSLEYTNRRGQRYFVFCGQTKSGKPKYYCSQRASTAGLPVEQLPEGYELHERPADAIVSVRKVRPSRIQPFERDQLTRWACELAAVPTVIDLDGDQLVVYASDTSLDSARKMISMLTGRPSSDLAREQDWIMQSASFSPMFCFTLQDEDARLYSIQRWCYRGGSEHWTLLSTHMPLEAAARHYLPHGGRESFFDLI